MSTTRPVRSSGRLTTPQPTQPTSAASTPATRGSRTRRTKTTRSASAEIQDADAARPGVRNRRAIRGASVDSTGSAAGSARPTKAKGKAREVIEELTTVEEDISRHDEEEDDTAAARQLMAEEALASPQKTTKALPQRSPGVLSNISGTTALSSFSAADAAELDPQTLVEELNSLHANSEYFLRSLTARDIYDDVRVPKSSALRTFNRKWSALSPSLAAYTVTEKDNDLIRPDIVNKGLFGSTVPSHVWESSRALPDALMHKANLAILAKKLITAERNQSASYDLIRELDVVFPRLFAKSFEGNGQVADSALGRLTQEAGLDIRTQLFLMVLEQHQNDPDLDISSTLEEIFFLGDGREKPVLKGWDIAGLQQDDGQVIASLRTFAIERFKTIQQHLQSNGEDDDTEDTIDVKQLEAAYPWKDFILRMLIWIQQRNAEIEKNVSDQGGIDEWQQKLQADVEQVAGGVAVRAPAEKSSKPEKRRKSRPSHGRRSVNVEGIDALKLMREEARAAEAAQAAALAQKAEQAHGIAKEHGQINIADDAEAHNEGQLLAGIESFAPPPQDGEDLEDAPEPMLPPLGTLEAMRLQERHDKENKPGKKRQIAQQSPVRRRAFIDEQDDAEPVAFGDGFDISQREAATTPMPTPSRASGKRRRVEEGDVSEDEGFEADARDIGNERRRRDLVRSNPSPAKKIARIEANAVESSSSRGPRTKLARSFGPQAVAVAQTQQRAITAQASRPPSTLELTRRQAQQNTAVQRAIAKSERRPKNLWTPREEEELVTMVGRYGCAWETIRDEQYEDGSKIFEGRTNVDLKDKARNLKQVFIKAQAPLPPNFEYVSLGRALEDRLRNAGFDIPF